MSNRYARQIALADCQGNGVLAPVPGVIGTLMAAEALKLVLG